MADVGSNHPGSHPEDTTQLANGTGSLQNMKDTAVNTAQQAINTIQNSGPVQALANGPVADNVKDQAAKTSSEFQNLANARVRPDQPAATGQPLTHYHSMFYSLLSWENPRATGISFAAAITFIFMARYLNILHYIFKFAYFILGVTATMEIAGKVVFNDGLASKMRPRKYWTIPKESLERSLDDVEQLLNFFVIEAQRIIYAENVWATIATFIAALVSYWLIKIVPFWGLSLIGTVVLYSAPLIYIKNREVIDSSMDQVTTIVSSQANQIRDITAHHASQATETLKSKTSQYTGYMGARKTATPPPASTPTVKSEDFPAAPKQEPLLEPVDVKQEHEPLMAH